MAGYRNNSDMIKGSMLMIFIDDNPIAFATSHSVSFTTNTSEVSTKDHGLYPSLVVNSQSWEVTAENIASADSINQLYTVLEKTKNSQPVTLKFAKPASWNDNGIVGPEGAEANWQAGDIIAQGSAYLTSLQMNAPAGDNATISATFTGVGAFVLDKAGAQISGSTGPVGPTGYTGPEGITGDKSYE